MQMDIGNYDSPFCVILDIFIQFNCLSPSMPPHHSIGLNLLVFLLFFFQKFWQLLSGSLSFHDTCREFIIFSWWFWLSFVLFFCSFSESFFNVFGGPVYVYLSKNTSPLPPISVLSLCLLSYSHKLKMTALYSTSIFFFH